MPLQIIIARVFLSVALFWMLIFAPAAAYSQPSKGASSAEWDKLVEAAKKEGKVTVSLPASGELKKQIEEQFFKRYGIEVETFTARASSAVRRMADEFKAGVRHFDLHVGGSSSIVSGMLDEGILDPIEPWLVLPEVKDPKQWWGGHLWVDNAKRFIYMFQAYLPESIWYNTDLAKPNEILFIRRFSQPEVERQDRLSRSTHARGRETRAGRSYGMSKGKSILKNLRHKNYISAAINACLRKVWPRDESPS